MDYLFLTLSADFQPLQMRPWLTSTSPNSPQSLLTQQLFSLLLVSLLITLTSPALCIFPFFLFYCASSGVSDPGTLLTAALQAPLPMRFPRQEYWSGLPFPPPGDLTNPGINLCPLRFQHWQAGSLPLEPPGKL